MSETEPLPSLADLAPDPAVDPASIEIVGRVIIDDIVKEGLASSEALESAMFTLTQWLTELETEPGDELILIRRKEAP